MQLCSSTKSWKVRRSLLHYSFELIVNLTEIVQNVSSWLPTLLRELKRRHETAYWSTITTTSLLRNNLYLIARNLQIMRHKNECATGDVNVKVSSIPSSPSIASRRRPAGQQRSANKASADCCVRHCQADDISRSQVFYRGVANISSQHSRPAYTGLPVPQQLLPYVSLSVRPILCQWQT